MRDIFHVARIWDARQGRRSWGFRAEIRIGKNPATDGRFRSVEILEAGLSIRTSFLNEWLGWKNSTGNARFQRCNVYECVSVELSNK